MKENDLLACIQRCEACFRKAVEGLRLHLAYQQASELIWDFTAIGRR